MSRSHYIAGKPHFVGKLPSVPDVKKLVAFWDIDFPLPEPKMMDQPTELQVPGTWTFDSARFTAKDYKLWTRTCRELSAERGSLVYLPRVELSRPEGRLFLPRHVTLWVSKPCRHMLSPWEAEDYTEYRVRQCEEAVLGKRREPTDAARRKRGKALALDLRIRHAGAGIWYVPSSGAGTEPRPLVSPEAKGYMVDMNKGTCECPDYKSRRLKCKHQYAIEHLEATQQAGWEMEYNGVFLGVDLADPRSSMAASFELLYGSLKNNPISAGLTKLELKGFSLVGITSGRLSTSKPNLRPMPRSEPTRFEDIVTIRKSDIDPLFAQPITPIALSSGDTLKVSATVTLQEE